MEIGYRGIGEPPPEPFESGDLLAHAPRAMNPQIPPVPNQVAPGLIEQRRDCAKAKSDVGRARRIEGPGVAPQLEAPARVMSLARRLVTLGRKHGDVEGRIVRPRPQHAVIEVEPVHLRADDVVVDLLRDRPARRIHGSEPSAVRGKLALLTGHRGRPVVRNAIDEDRWLEPAPVLEELEEIVIGGRHEFSLGRVRQEGCPAEAGAIPSYSTMRWIGPRSTGLGRYGGGSTTNRGFWTRRANWVSAICASSRASGAPKQ